MVQNPRKRQEVSKFFFKLMKKLTTVSPLSMLQVLSKTVGPTLPPKPLQPEVLSVLFFRGYMFMTRGFVVHILSLLLFVSSYSNLLSAYSICSVIVSLFPS